jgi:cell division GTPase FtsZ
MFEIIDQSPQEGHHQSHHTGGCGGNAVDRDRQGHGRRRVHQRQYRCAALKRSTAPIQLQLGSSLTRGLGAPPRDRRDAANEDRERIAS